MSVAPKTECSQTHFPARHHARRISALTAGLAVYARQHGIVGRSRPSTSGYHPRAPRAAPPPRDRTSAGSTSSASRTKCTRTPGELHELSGRPRRGIEGHDRRATTSARAQCALESWQFQHAIPIRPPRRRTNDAQSKPRMTAPWWKGRWHTTCQQVGEREPFTRGTRRATNTARRCARASHTQISANAELRRAAPTRAIRAPTSAPRPARGHPSERSHTSQATAEPSQQGRGEGGAAQAGHSNRARLLLLPIQYASRRQSRESDWGEC